MHDIEFVPTVFSLARQWDDDVEPITMPEPPPPPPLFNWLTWFFAVLWIITTAIVFVLVFAT